MRKREAAILLLAVLFAVDRPYFSQTAPNRQQQLEYHARQAQKDLQE
ncbi:MAG: hypothetical protein ACRD1N_03295 [Terriglobia bacterium]